VSWHCQIFLLPYDLCPVFLDSSSVLALSTATCCRRDHFQDHKYVHTFHIWSLFADGTLYYQVSTATYRLVAQVNNYYVSCKVYFISHSIYSTRVHCIQHVPYRWLGYLNIASPTCLINLLSLSAATWSQYLWDTIKVHIFLHIVLGSPGLDWHTEILPSRKIYFLPQYYVWPKIHVHGWFQLPM
jgi:hypothetical protein